MYVLVSRALILGRGVIRPNDRLETITCDLKQNQITSRDNSLLRHARAVRDGKNSSLIFVEGLRLCEEAAASKLGIEAVIYSEQIARKERAAAFLDSLKHTEAKLASVTESLLKSISFTQTPQGIVMLASRPEFDAIAFQLAQPENPLLVVMHGVNNPVNVGAIVRTAEAAGSTGVITTRGTADPFSPKALRGAMGSAFRLPIWSGADFADVIGWCRERKIHRLCADVAGSRLYTEIDLRPASAIVVGPESTGLALEEIAAADEVVRIPMKPPTESLNVAVATGILLFEANRQRNLIRLDLSTQN